MRVCPARKTCSLPDSRQELQAFLTNSQSQFVITLEHFGKISFSRSLFWDSLIAENMHSSSSSPVHMLLTCCCMCVCLSGPSRPLVQRVVGPRPAATRDHTYPIACLDCLANATPCPPYLHGNKRIMTPGACQWSRHTWVVHVICEYTQAELHW